MSYSSLEKYIIKIYCDLSIQNLESLKDLDIEYVSEKFNIKTHYYDEISELIYFKGTYRIFLNEELSKEKKWQLYAQKLSLILKDSNYKISHSKQIWSEKEFSYHFCIPTFLLEQLDFSNQANPIQLIATTFNVEYHFAKKRYECWLKEKKKKVIYC